MNTRRQFLITAAMGGLTVAACRPQRQAAGTSAPPSTPGAPPAFGTAPGTGPDVSPATFAEAEKLAQVSMTDAERATAAGNWRRTMAPLVERRVGPRKVALEPDRRACDAMGSTHARRRALARRRDKFVRSDSDPRSSAHERRRHCVRARSRSSRAGSKARQLSSERLTSIYLDRIAQHDPKLRSIITLTRDRRARSGEAGRRGNRRGQVSRSRCTASRRASRICSTPPGIATTYGAEPFRNRVPPSRLSGRRSG